MNFKSFNNSDAQWWKQNNYSNFVCCRTESKVWSPLVTEEGKTHPYKINLASEPQVSNKLSACFWFYLGLSDFRAVSGQIPQWADHVSHLWDSAICLEAMWPLEIFRDKFPPSWSKPALLWRPNQLPYQGQAVWIRGVISNVPDAHIYNRVECATIARSATFTKLVDFWIWKVLKEEENGSLITFSVWVGFVICLLTLASSQSMKKMEEKAHQPSIFLSVGEILQLMSGKLAL